MVNILQILLRLTITILSIPVAIAVTIAFYHNMILVQQLATSMNFFLWGMVSYMVMHTLLFKPTYLYVLGHEAVHAGMGWLFGAKINSFQVSSDGGSVGMDKSNVIIELSPYFIPIYTIIITLIYFAATSSYKTTGSVFIFLIGFTLAFHLISTIEVMKTRQTDILKSGYFFSVIFVYIVNLVIISSIFALVFPAFKLSNFFSDLWKESSAMYVSVANQLFSVKTQIQQ